MEDGEKARVFSQEGLGLATEMAKQMPGKGGLEERQNTATREAMRRLVAASSQTAVAKMLGVTQGWVSSFVAEGSAEGTSYPTAQIVAKAAGFDGATEMFEHGVPHEPEPDDEERRAKKAARLLGYADVDISAGLKARSLEGKRTAMSIFQDIERARLDRRDPDRLGESPVNPSGSTAKRPPGPPQRRHR